MPDKLQELISLLRKMREAQIDHENWPREQIYLDHKWMTQNQVDAWLAAYDADENVRASQPSTEGGGE